MNADDLRALADELAAVEHPVVAPAHYLNGWLACVDAIRARADGYANDPAPPSDKPRSSRTVTSEEEEA